MTARLWLKVWLRDREHPLLKSAMQKARKRFSRTNGNGVDTPGAGPSAGPSTNATTAPNVSGSAGPSTGPSKPAIAGTVAGRGKNRNLYTEEDERTMAEFLLQLDRPARAGDWAIFQQAVRHSLYLQVIIVISKQQ